MTRIYLDNAVTSWPKPTAVYDAVDQYQRQIGAAAGRGVYREAEWVNHVVEQARFRVAQLIGADSPQEIVFTYSGTDALNLALRGLLRPGDHVITSVWEHNSVLRPLRYLAEHQGIEVTQLTGGDSPDMLPTQVQAALRDRTRLVVLTHASNVTGHLLPIAAVGHLLQDHPAWLLVDAAQTLGQVPVKIVELGCDLLAAPGHKGLLAPTGTGLLYVSRSVQDQLQPLRLGGTGSASDSDHPALEFPGSFEPGNLNVPGLVGLHAGLEYLEQRGVAEIGRHEQSLIDQLRQGIERLPHVHTYRLPTTETVGLLSFNVDGYAPEEIAVLLDQAGGIQVRAGYHCAPLSHRQLQSHLRGGTVRVSCGPFNQLQDVQTLLQLLVELGS